MMPEQCPPCEPSVDLVADIPRKLRQAYPDLVALVRTLESVLRECECDMLGVPYKMWDPQCIPSRLLSLRLAAFGFRLDCLDLTDEQVRRLLDGLIITIYKQKGTIRGIVNLIRLLLGIEVTATIQSADIGDAWEIGIDEIGLSTFIGTDDPASFLVITATQDLTEDQVANMLCVINFMRVAGTEVLLDYPNKPTVDETFWLIGVSEMGVTTYISDAPDGTYENNYPFPGTARADFVN